MQPTSVRLGLETNQHIGAGGMQPWAQRPSYETYKSKYGPKYKVAPHFHGISIGRALRFTSTAVGFGAAAGLFAIFFFNGIPRVQKDILMKVPVIGDYFHKEIPPEDNPF